MDRALSSDIDSSMATRNQGQLISQARVTTEALRTPGLVSVPNATGSAQPLAPGTLQGGVGFVDVSVPFIGTINWKSLALGAVLGLVVYKMSSGKRRALKERTKAAVNKALS